MGATFLSPVNRLLQLLAAPRMRTARLPAPKGARARCAYRVFGGQTSPRSGIRKNFAARGARHFRSVEQKRRRRSTPLRRIPSDVA